MESLVTGFSHIGLRVAELDRSRAFYELLGFRFRVGPVGPEPVAILDHPCGLELNLVLNAGAHTAPNILMDIPEKHAGYTHMALEVSDLEAAAAALTAAGHPITEGPVTFPTGVRAIFVRDPDLNVVELNQPPA